MTPQTAVMSQLLCDLPKAAPELATAASGSLIDSTVSPVAEPLPADVDFADSLKYGHVEGLNAWAWRVLGEAP
ncbi:hypothetical protein [Streptomyces sp. NPDC002402]